MPRLAKIIAISAVIGIITSIAYIEITAPSDDPRHQNPEVGYIVGEVGGWTIRYIGLHWYEVKGIWIGYIIGYNPSLVEQYGVRPVGKIIIDGDEMKKACEEGTQDLLIKDKINGLIDRITPTLLDPTADDK